MRNFSLIKIKYILFILFVAILCLSLDKTSDSFMGRDGFELSCVGSIFRPT